MSVWRIIPFLYNKTFMISVKNLSRHYGSNKAVDSVTFSVSKGEVVGLLGHNGAGKTTIMKMLTGFIEPNNGEVLIKGLTLGQDTPEIQRRIGYLPENCPVWPEMRVIDYLFYQARLHLVNESERDELVLNAIEKTALIEKATAKIETLSRGYRQRVGVAQALLHKPDILILDEPTNGLDPNQILQMRDLIKELAENATVIISTHVLQEVQAICERVLIMRRGKLVLDSKINDLQRENQYIFTFQSLNTPLVGLLSEFDGVTQIEKIEGAKNSYKIEVDKKILPELVKFVVSDGASVETIIPQTRNLETVFAEVSTEGELN